MRRYRNSPKRPKGRPIRPVLSVPRRVSLVRVTLVLKTRTKKHMFFVHEWCKMMKGISGIMENADKHSNYLQNNEFADKHSINCISTSNKFEVTILSCNRRDIPSSQEVSNALLCILNLIQSQPTFCFKKFQWSATLTANENASWRWQSILWIKPLGSFEILHLYVQWQGWVKTSPFFF